MLTALIVILTIVGVVGGTALLIIESNGNTVDRVFLAVVGVVALTCLGALAGWW